MTVSKAFWKITAKNIGTIITYSIILIMFGSMNMSGNSTTVEYEAVRPNIVVFNHDEERGITKKFLDYLGENADIAEGYEDDDKLKDALFYEQVSVVVDIPENYSQDLTFGRKPELRLRSSAGYVAEVSKAMIRRFVTTAESYAALSLSENVIVEKLDNALKTDVKVEVRGAVDASKYVKATRYFSFANYSILACVITIICLIMTSFNRQTIKKRNLVGGIDIRKMNRILLRNSCIYSALVWLLYVVVGFIVIGAESLLNMHGLLYVSNAFVFCIFATTLAYFISSFVTNTGAVNGIMNVVALGSSFLCGAFVPAEYLPEGVLAFAHVLPSYYYIDANNKIMLLENDDFDAIWPVLLNILIVLCSSVVVVIITNIISKKRQKIA